MPAWSAIFSELEIAGFRVRSEQMPAPVSGGDISAAWRVSTDSGELFVKTGPADCESMFTAEADALSEIAQSKTIRVPQVVRAGATDGSAYLAMEWLRLDRVTPEVEERLGDALAQMHRHQRGFHGWHRDNTIGLTPQINTPCEDWCEFFAEQRLRPQLKLAFERGFTGELQTSGEQLLRRLPLFLGDPRETKSLLHGDLWSGNRSSCDGQPVIYDPATYYGDRETDLAMTRLFGGFGAAFYAAYEAAWPLDAGSAERQVLYQLYHVLNHLNLFGGAYAGQALKLMKRIQ